MTGNDILFVVRWWAMLFLAGATFIPLAALFFSRFVDKGYAFAKILGVIIVSYTVFVFGVFRITPFLPVTIYGVYGVFSILIFYLTRKKLKTIFTKKTLVFFVLEEVLFFVALYFWSYVRGFNPEIYGLEKYMDFGFVNSILRSTYFPPKDMWFTPLPINYYYFGHFITAVLTKASAIPSFITYNLMIATLFALTFIESFSLGINLLKKWKNETGKMLFRTIFGGLLIACLVTLAGNLHTIYTFFQPYENDKPVPVWNLEFSLFNPCYHKASYIKMNNNGVKQTITCSDTEKEKVFMFPNSYWYPNATRFIHNTIHEFPIYSWVVADLHGHVTDIPLVLLTITALFVLFVKQKEAMNETTDIQTEKITYSRNKIVKFIQKVIPKLIALKVLFFIGFLISVMYMTNAWDGLTYLLLTGIVLLYIQLLRAEKDSKEHTLNNPLYFYLPKHQYIRSLKRFLAKHSFVDALTGTATYLFVIGITFILFSRPFSINFDPSEIVGGIGVVAAPSFLLQKNTSDTYSNSSGYDNRNIINKILIPDHCRSLLNTEELSKVTTQYSVGKIGPFLFEPDHCLRSPWWQMLILYGFFYFFAVAFILYLWKRKNTNRSDSETFALILIVTATILIILPEFFYMKDIYPDHYRANTMFKLVFQAFIMLSITSGFIIIETISHVIFKSLTGIKKVLYILYFLITVILLSLVFIYPFFATKSYYNNLSAYNTLDGLSYLKNRNPDDYYTIQWLNFHIKGQPAILEAQGDSYTDYERISANTGFPTVLGWFVHEWLWRGQQAPGPRASEVQTIYESSDISETAKLIQKYHISYVIIGNLEHQKYTNLNEEKFTKLGQKIFQSGNTQIIKISTQ